LSGIFSVLIFPSFFCFAFLLRQKEKRADQTRSNAIKRDQTRFSISTSYEIFSSVLQKKNQSIAETLLSSFQGYLWLPLQLQLQM